jgi:hypothetical protein
MEHWIMGTQDRRSGISSHRGFAFQEKGRGTLHKSPICEMPTRSGPSDRGRTRTVDLWKGNFGISGFQESEKSRRLTTEVPTSQNPMRLLG